MTLGQHAHVHVCSCGSELRCKQADCAVSEPYQCPTCDLRQKDEWLQQADVMAALATDPVILSSIQRFFKES